jgi:hypothetical protein
VSLFSSLILLALCFGSAALAFAACICFLFSVPGLQLLALASAASAAAWAFSFCGFGLRLFCLCMALSLAFTASNALRLHVLRSALSFFFFCCFLHCNSFHFCFVFLQAWPSPSPLSSSWPSLFLLLVVLYIPFRLVFFLSMASLAFLAWACLSASMSLSGASSLNSISAST